MIVKILDSVENYEEAIKFTCDRLEEVGSIKPSYFKAIMKNVEALGPYFCVDKDMAMPHARPEDGAIESDMCVLKLNNPVDLLGNSVSVFFTVSAKDSESHLGLLSKVAEICMDKARFKKVVDAKTEQEIIDLMQ